MGWGDSFQGFYTCPHCGKKMPDCYKTDWAYRGRKPYKPRVDVWFTGAAKANFYKHVRSCQLRKEKDHG
jgi:hypothetical protein